MNCNGTRLHILVGVYLVYILLQMGVVAEDTNSTVEADTETENDNELGYNGNLYDVFKKRLDQVFKELYNNVSDSATDVKAPETAELPEQSKKRSAMSDCLYEEFKRRLDKFNNEFILDSSKAFKRRSGASDEGTGEKRSTVREGLYEEYKKRLDKISNDLSLDGEKVFDRSGRGILNALGVQGPKVQSKNGNVNTVPKVDSDGHHIRPRNFYAEYKKKLNQLTRELYKKDDERLQRQSTENETNSKMRKQSRSNGSSTGKKQRKANSLERQQNHAQQQQSGKDKRRAADGAYRIGGDTLNYGIDVTSSYPAVLTKALESSMTPISSSPKGLLTSVAQKMNMSTLELAKNLAGMSHPYDTKIEADPKMAETLRKFIETTVTVKKPETTAPAPSPAATHPAAPATPIAPPIAPLVAPPAAPQELPHREEHTAFEEKSRVAGAVNGAIGEQPSLACDTAASGGGGGVDSAVSAHISFVLDKVLSKLERLQQDRTQEKGSAADNCLPEDAPCNVMGTWSAYVAGLRFEITPGKQSERSLGGAEKNNKLLSIQATECMPPKEHRIVEPSWKFMGSTAKELGGPFFMFTQSRLDDMAVTFLGYCRTCGGIDTIYGSWSILRPSKDCQDITTTIENKREILRRYNMDAKRKQRYKDILFDRSNYGKLNTD